MEVKIPDPLSSGRPIIPRGGVESSVTGISIYILFHFPNERFLQIQTQPRSKLERAVINANIITAVGNAVEGPPWTIIGR